MSQMIKLRRDTISKQREDRAVDDDRQQIVFCLAVRGEGKSTLLEALGEKDFKRGYTMLDLHAPPNFENAFWCIPRFKELNKNGEPDKQVFEDDMHEFIKNPAKFMKQRESYPVTILCSESFQWDQDALDRFNGRIYTAEEFYEMNKDHPELHFDLIYPQKKERKDWGREMIRFVRVPNLKKNFESDENIKAGEILKNAILDCRKQRRFLVLNKQAFGSENQYFWCMELIMRNLPVICDEHFIRLFPRDVGVKTERQMKPLERRWHRITVIHRELSDLAPAKLKADKGGESTSVKKALLGFSRVCRHWEVNWYADFQHQNSTEGSIRQNCDTWLYKKYNRGLGGDDAKLFFDKVEWLRKRILIKGKNTPKAKMIADSWFPKVEELSKKYFYAKFLSNNIKLFRVPENRHQHKEPYMKFPHLTGIKMWHDLQKIPRSGVGNTGKNSKTDQTSLYNTMKLLRNPPKGKPLSWKDVGAKLGVMQQKNELSYSSNLKEKSNDWLSATFGKLKKKFEILE